MGPGPRGDRLRGPAPAAVCTSCGTALAESGVCEGCGSSGSAPERRLVTVLFADLAGYTRLCSSQDVEEVFLLVRPLMNALRRACEDLGGVVPSIEGDGFMAVFGAQAARDDDPQRALHAAALLQGLVEERRRTYGRALGGLRVGVNAGEVLVAPSREPGGFAVAGDPVNVASRLCGLAAEGEVLVTAAVASLVSPQALFDTEQSVFVRNRDEPVVHRGFRWRDLDSLPLGRNGRSTTPYVGRRVDEALEATVARGGVLHLVGEAGAGKTRSLQHLAAGRDDVLVLTAPSFLGPTILRQLAAALLRVGPTLAAGAEQALRQAAGDAGGAGEREDDGVLAEAVRAALAAGSVRALVVDDAHLAGRRDLLVLLELARSRPPGVALVLASRTEGAPEVLVDPVHLDLLEDDEARALVDLLLPRAPERVVRQLLARSGGNPLYLEQGAQLLVDDGTVELTATGCEIRRPDQLGDLPVGMRLFVSSRLDLLDEGPRELLALVAVVADPVDLDLLLHLAGRGPETAEHLEVLADRGLLRWEEGQRLRFRHQVVRDVAYERLLRSRRVALHRAAAEWYAVLPVAGLLGAEAAHLEAAVELGDGDCDLVRRAVTVLGQWAMALLEESTGQAAEVAERGLSLNQAHVACGADAAALFVARAVALERLSRPQEALTASKVALEAARSAGDPVLLGLALQTAATAEVWDQSDDRISVLREAESHLEQQQDRPGLARLRLRRAWHQVEHGLGGVLEAAEEAYNVGVRWGDPRLASAAALDLALLLPVRDPAQALRWREVAAASLREGDVVAPAKLAYGRTVVESVRGEPARALEAAAELRRTASAALMAHYEQYADLYELQALTDLGRLEAAEEVLDRARLGAEDRPVVNIRANVLAREAALRARQGRSAEARAALDELAAIAAEAPFYAYLLDETRGHILLDQGWFADAAEHLDAACVAASELGHPAIGLRPTLHRLIARLSSGDRPPIAEQREIRAAARELGAPSFAALATRWLELEEMLRLPHNHAPDLPPTPDLAEARALDLELEVLRGGTADLLLAAAEEWASLGTVVWTARALLWHSELTGTPHPEAEELLDVLEAPAGLAEEFRAQARRPQR